MEFEDEFDAVFSNAVLHWISETDIVIGNVYRALRRGGRFVGEFGGYGNCAAIVTALVDELELRGIDGLNASPWHFPTADEFSNRLGRSGIQRAVYRAESRARRRCPKECRVFLRRLVAVLLRMLRVISALDIFRLFATGLETAAPEERRVDRGLCAAEV